MPTPLALVAINKRGEFATGPVNVNDHPFLTFPFRYGVTEDALDSSYPLALTFDQAMEFSMRFRTLEITLGVVTAGDPATSVTRTFAASRKRVLSTTEDLIEERELFQPGLDNPDSNAVPALMPTKFIGIVSEPDWNGNAGATLEYGGTIDIFFKPFPTGERMWVKPNGPRFYPSISIGCFLNFTTPGTEYSGEFFNNGAFTPNGSAEAPIFVGYGGRVLTIDISQTNLGSMTNSFSIIPKQWFPWKDSSGSPKWDENTGLALR